MTTLLASTSDTTTTEPGPAATRAVRRLLATIGAVRIGFVVVPMLSYWLAADLHLTPRTVAALMTAFGIGWAASAPLGGWLTDHIGAKATIATSSLIAAGAYLILGSGLSHPALLAVGVLVAGATFDLYRPPLQAALAAHADGRDASVQRRLYLMLNLSRLVSCLLAAGLAGLSWTALFVVNAAANVLLAMIALRQPAGLYPHAVARAGTVSRNALADPRLLAITAITAAFYLVHLQSTVSLPVLLHAHGTSGPAYALLLALDPAVVITVQILCGRWLGRLPLLISCAAGMILVAGGLTVTGLTGTLTAAAWTLPIWVTGELLVLTAAPAVVAAIAPAERRGAYFGTWAATQGAAAVGAPLLAAAIPGPALWAAVGGLALAAAIGCIAWHRSPHRP
jgi:MFS family permease